MSKTLHCRDVGPDCDFIARGESEDDVMRQVAEHARTVHGIDPVPPELAQKARSVMREEPSSPDRPV